LIFFDLDDTLMDFRTAEYQGVKSFYAQFIHYLNQTEDAFYNNWIKLGSKNFERYLRGELTFEQQKIERMIGLLSESDVEIDQNNAMSFFQIYLDHFENNWRLYDDVIPCLELFKDDRLGIITNGNPAQQREKLIKLRITDYFQTIVVSGDIGVSKPNSDIFIHACRLAQMHPTECFFVGDNLESDIHACEKVDMRGVWLNRNNSKLRHKRSIRSLSELKLWFESGFKDVADIS